MSVLWVSLRTGEDICPSFCTGGGVVFPILFLGVRGGVRAHPPSRAPFSAVSSAGRGGVQASLTTQAAAWQASVCPF